MGRDIMAAVGAQVFIVFFRPKPVAFVVAAVFHPAGPRDLDHAHRVDSDETRRGIR